MMNFSKGWQTTSFRQTSQNRKEEEERENLKNSREELAELRIREQGF